MRRGLKEQEVGQFEVKGREVKCQFEEAGKVLDLVEFEVFGGEALEECVQAGGEVEEGYVLGQEGFLPDFVVATCRILANSKCMKSCRTGTFFLLL